MLKQKELTGQNKYWFTKTESGMKPAFGGKKNERFFENYKTVCLSF